ncbi:MAG: hypothetical protein KBC43_08515 [Bacteroidales bacterium]|nr:hypothetical protein [Bacteroidales bacterium]
MKKNILILAAVLFCLALSVNAQKVAYYESKWYPGVVKDNEADLLNLMQYNEKSGMLFLVSNDDSRLYITLVATDKAAIQKIMRFGLTTWIDPEAKGKKRYAIEFPVSSVKLPAPAADPGRGDRKEARMAMMAAKNGLMILQGFAEKNESLEIDPRMDENFNGRFEMMEGGKLSVSLILALDRMGLSIAGAADHPVSIAFETGYMDVTGAMPAGGGQPGGGGMHGGGMYGGGMPGGGPPPGAGGQAGSDTQDRPDIGQLASPTRLRIKTVKLAPKP